MPPPLIVFDIDGTLLQSIAVHQQALADTVASSRLLRHRSTRWSDYAHHTDSGIFWEAFERGAGRAPTPDECQAFELDFQARYLDLARAVIYREVGGAAALLRDLLHAQEWSVAFATGSYRGAAEHKLACLGIRPGPSCPLVTASEFRTRREIVAAAAALAAPASRVVSVGDGPWDARAASELAIDFVGVARDEGARLLTALGARAVLPDFLDRAAVLRSFAAGRA